MKKQKNIVSSPNEKMAKTEVGFEIGDEPVRFTIMSNIKSDEIYPVLENWLLRTDEYTPESLVKYINSKSAYGFKASTI